jgi:addiction module RelB/DinJ family antitoxin
MLKHSFIIQIAMKTLQIRVSDELREEADQVLEQIGMDMPTAIRVYLKKIVHSRSIPFTLEADQTWVAEPVSVDAETQRMMDSVAESWSKISN